MRIKSFTTVVLRIIGLMTIIYGLMMLLFILVTLAAASGYSGASLSGMGAMIMLQFLLPALMILLGIILMAASRALAGTLTRDLEDGAPPPPLL
jgi:hypothetical protein